MRKQQMWAAATLMMASMTAFTSLAAFGANRAYALPGSAGREFVAETSTATSKVRFTASGVERTLYAERNPTLGLVLPDATISPADASASWSSAGGGQL